MQIIHLSVEQSGVLFLQSGVTTSTVVRCFIFPPFGESLLPHLAM